MDARQKQVLDQLAQLSPNTTMCPGKLARECGTVLSKFRSDLLAMAQAGKIRLTQHGKAASPKSLKGPFRVSLPRRRS